MLMVALLAPVALGVNVTLIWQLVPAAREPQALTSEKSDAFRPVTVIPVKCTLVLPVFVTVTVRGALEV